MLALRPRCASLAARTLLRRPIHLRPSVRPFRIAVPRLSSSKDDAAAAPKNQVKVPLPATDVKPKIELRENIYTIPNFLTVSRIIACPFLGYFIVQGNFTAATALLVYAGATDWVGSVVPML